MRLVLPERLGRLCRIVRTEGAPGMDLQGQARARVLVEFPDGLRIAAPRLAVKRQQAGRSPFPMPTSHHKRKLAKGSAMVARRPQANRGGYMLVIQWQGRAWRLPELAAHLRMSQEALRKRLARGWSMEEATGREIDIDRRRRT